ncbi:MAG: hypothetical protein ACOZBW_05150 [Thermodesulfobacteriota bacterium]
MKAVSGSLFLHIVFETLDQLLVAEYKPQKKIGFTVKEKQRAYGEKRQKKTGAE